MINNLGNSKKKGNIENNRFSENDAMWPGLSLGLEVKKILYEKNTKFQKILVFESISFGNVLVLDGVIQLSQRDESAYQEMLAHLPLFCHLNPEKVLIIGGGDGGILREVLKHDSIKKTVLCEIDQGVIDVAEEFFPEVSSCLRHKKSRIVIGNGSKFISESNEKFDVVIVDSSDPIGPANSLFTEEFYKSIEGILNTGGIVAIQGESLFLHKEFAKNLKDIMSGLFEYIGYSQVHVPTYPGGNIGLLICSNSNKVNEPIRKIPKNIKENLKYYSEEIHKASYILPPSYNF